jgi:serine protease Do
MQVLRSVDGKAKTIDVTVEIAKQPESRAVAEAENGVIATDIGLTVQTVTPEVAGDLGLSKDAKGVVVNEIAPDSRAAKADLQVGDVITQVRYKGKETAVESTDDFGGALTSIPESDSFSVLRTREGTAKLVRIE